MKAVAVLRKGIRRRVISAWKNAVLGCAMLATFSGAAVAQDRSSVASDIVINQGQTARNVACVLCSVYVHGTVTGNVAVVLGSVTVDGTVDQRVAIVMGNLNVRSTGVVAGDTAIAMGAVRQDAGGRVEGRSASAPTGFVVAMLAVPLGILALAIWFIVWLVRRARQPRYPYPPPPVPPGY